mgnify:CR=1 FL=1
MPRIWESTAFYGLMGVVAAVVLPVDQVAGQPLNVVAEAVLSKPLYYLFMIGGAWMALLTTLNRSIASCTKPLMQACNDGWYPSSLARLHPKFRTPIILLEIYYVIGFVPIIFNFDIGIISDITITVGSITKAMLILSLLRMPKVLPGAWKQSNFHVKDSMLMAIGVLDLIVVVISGVTSSLELPVKLLAANLAVVVFAFVFGSVRFRSGKVKVENLEFGADPHVEGIYTGEDIKEIRKNAIHAGLKLVDCPIRHLGTEKAQQLYLAIQNYLADNGVEMLFSTECENIILEDEECKGVLLRQGDGEPRAVYGDTVVIGTGRRGADWLEKICAEHHIAHKPGTVDIGVRVECRNEVMEKVNKVLYESKLSGDPKPWKKKVRTF